jgi:hypothetical protein
MFRSGLASTDALAQLSVPDRTNGHHTRGWHADRSCPTMEIAFLQFLDLNSFSNQYFDPGMTSRNVPDIAMGQTFQHGACV